MELTFLLKGLIVGFLIAVPVGPVAVLCIHRTLAEGRASGFASGLGAATADTLYGCIGGFGLTFISNFLADHRLWFRLIGAIFLCYLGFRIFFAEPAEREVSVKGNGLIGAYASTFFLTLTNPTTVISFAALFAGLGLTITSRNYFSAGVLVLGVFIGSSLWWLLLSGGVNFSRARIRPKVLRWINRICGIIVTGFGLLVLLSLV